MRSNRSRQIIVCVLSLTLLLSISLYIQSSYNHSAEALSYTEIGTLNSPAAPISSNVQAAPLSPAAAIKEKNEDPQPALAAKKKPAVKAAASKGAFNTYEVTAYYLNIRANAYATSKILTVVKKGTMLEIVKATDNGWLLLRSGGYVHGGYAKLVSGKKKPSGEVKTLSAAAPMPRIGAVRPVPQPAVVKRIGAEPGKLKYAVKSDSGLSEDHISKIFKGTALAGNGLEKAVLEIEDKYGINAYFTIAVMKLESGNGKSKLAKSKNNLFGLNAVSGDEGRRASSFKTKGDSVRKFGQLIAKNYVGKGYTTIDKVAMKYCPANSRWPGLVKSIMKGDNRKLL
jgi:hypothetical protein